MCGIVGIAAADGLCDEHRGAARRMADAIEHRGPDDQGFHDSETITIGMRRLSIIDVDGGHQPIANEDGTVHVVCNGEIYNFRELRRELEALGHRFKTQSDTEVLVHLYEEHGEEFVDRIDGMFAIALHDLSRQRLLLVRDRLGIKPLYYSIDGSRLVFASEVKSILRAPSTTAALDTAALRDYLSIGYCVAPQTIFKNISKLQPASMLVWERGAVRTRRYWSIPASTRTDLTEADWVESIIAALSSSVASHMVSDVPIGAFLSGGIDSTAVVALMTDQSKQPVNTYSIGYSGSSVADYFNELPFADEAANLYATNHHRIEVNPDVASLLPTLIWHLEEPISDSAIATTYLVAQLAAESVTVILSGVGGDELFAGYNRYLGDYYGARYNKLPAWLRSRTLPALASMLPSGRQSRLMDLSRYARSFVSSASLPWREQYRHYIAIQGRAMLDSLLDQTALGDVDGFDRVILDEKADDPLLRLLRVDWQTQLSEDLLLLTDKMTMANSIECRVPFLDHRLTELAATIPTEQKRPGRQLKYLLKKALEPHLPESILYRRKRGFGAPVGSWFKEELRPLREALLSRETIASRGVFAWPSVAEIIDSHDRNKADFTDLIMVLLNLEIWCRLFLDGRSPDDIGAELGELCSAASVVSL